MKLTRTPLEQEFDDDPTCVWEHPNGWRIVKETMTNVGLRGGSVTSFTVFTGDKLPGHLNGVRRYEFSTMRSAREACDAAERGCWDCLRDEWRKTEVRHW